MVELSTHVQIHAGIAQLVEHSPEERRVAGSSPAPSTTKRKLYEDPGEAGTDAAVYTQAEPCILWYSREHIPT